MIIKKIQCVSYHKDYYQIDLMHECVMHSNRPNALLGRHFAWQKQSCVSMTLHGKQIMVLLFFGRGIEKNLL